MPDDRFEPGFELRLAGELGGLADEGTRPFDATEISRAAVGRARARRRSQGLPIWWRPALAGALLAVALIGVGVVGGFIMLPNNDLHPNPSFVPFTPSPTGLSSPTDSLLPTSGPVAPTLSPVPITAPPSTSNPTATPTPKRTPRPRPTPTPTLAPTPSEEPSPSTVPTPTPSPTVAPVSSVVELAPGDSHACALASDGRIFCWGYNDMGQLGDGTLDYRDYPTLPVVGIDDATAVASGIRFSCAVRSDGSLWCWGEDPGSDGSSAVPWQVPGIDDATDVTAGGAFACALRAGGAVACWGIGDLGQLGNGVFERGGALATPQAVVGLDDAIEISAGWNHACAVRSDHSLWCWGGNGDGATGYGQLGTGTLDNSATPVQVQGLDNVTDVAAGGWTTCAVQADGTAWCWGYGQQGGLGDGNGTDSATPVQVAGIDDAQQVTVGDFHACVLRSDGGVWCWGDTDWSPAGGPALTPVEGQKYSSVAPRSIATGAYQEVMFIDQRGRVWWWGFGTVQTPERWPIGP